MRIERGDREPRPRDAEQGLEAGGGDPTGPHDDGRLQRTHRVGERQVDGDRYDPQGGAGQHHRDVGAAGQLGQELGVAGMPEARILQRLLLDRIGCEAGDRAGLRHLHGTLDGGQRRRRVGGIGMAGPGRHLEPDARAQATP